MYVGNKARNSSFTFSFLTTDANGNRVTYSGGTLKIFKNGSTTERTSAVGITTSKDHDGVTGYHVVTVDLSDNTDAGFWAPHNSYEYAFYDLTVSGQTGVPVQKFWGIENDYIPGEIGRGTLSAGSASGGTLPNSAWVSSTDSFYQGSIEIVAGTGAGQWRDISAYVGSTRVFTVDAAWTTTPDNTSVVRVFTGSAPVTPAQIADAWSIRKQTGGSNGVAGTRNQDFLAGGGGNIVTTSTTMIIYDCDGAVARSLTVVRSPVNAILSAAP